MNKHIYFPIEIDDVVFNSFDELNEYQLFIKHLLWLE